MRVVLPQPEGPSRPVTRPVSTVKWRSSRTVREPRVTVRAVAVTASSGASSGGGFLFITC